MRPPVYRLTCPAYSFSQDLDLIAVSHAIDHLLLEHFEGTQVVIRGIQSEKHQQPKERLVEHILQTGTDHYAEDNEHEVKVANRPIDLFGYACTIETPPVVLPILEGFHKWKPKALERPQRRVDIWMIYDAGKLENVEYTHTMYNVKAKDGYVFDEPSSKLSSLLGVIIID